MFRYTIFLVLAVFLVMFSGCCSMTTPSTFPTSDRYLTNDETDSDCPECPECPTCEESEECEVCVETLEDKIAECESKQYSDDDECLAALAFEESNPQVCERIGGYNPDYNQAQCIIAIAVKTNKPGYCDLLSYIYQNDCYALFE